MNDVIVLSSSEEFLSGVDKSLNQILVKSEELNDLKELIRRFPKQSHIFVFKPSRMTNALGRAFDQFKNFSLESNKDRGIYYVRRPNQHTKTKDYDFVYLPPGRRLAANKKIVAYISSATPNFLKPFAKKVYSSFLDLIRGSDQKNPSIKKVNSKSVPESLIAFEQMIEEWAPDTDTLVNLLTDTSDSEFKAPTSIHVILLNKCNLACVMCPYHSPKYKEHHSSNYFDDLKIMSIDTFEKIAKYAGENGVALQLGQIEEAMMHKNLIEFIQIAKSTGVPSIHLTTNGTLLTKEKAIQLSNSGLTSIMFSIDASDPETYKRIRGKDLVELEDKIKFFLSLEKAKKMNTMASFILQDQKTEEREDFLNKWRGFGIKQVTYYVLTDHNLKTGEFIRKEEHYDKGKRYACASPWVQSVVFPDGDISLCCKTMTDVGWKGVLEVGNINKEEFKNIWNGTRYKDLREELIRNSFKQFSTCSNCQIWSAHSHFVEESGTYTKDFNETMATYTFK